MDFYCLKRFGMFDFRFWIIFITGFCSLGYQVVWQRYLAVLVGSQARSLTIIVAVFLLGLTLGYYLFGHLAKKIKQRRSLLKAYGFVELLTGLYAVSFPSFFNFLFSSPLSHGNHLGGHILMTALLLFPATILMGATVPVMTTVLPEDDHDINLTHAWVYGFNTLGAFGGVLVVGFYLLPKLGYEFCLTLLGLINSGVSFFYLMNKLKGESYQKRNIESLNDQNYGTKILYGFGFVAGATCLSLEILWFRILGLSLGNSYIVFPFILSIFILMIGLGSLTLKNTTAKNFQKTLCLSFAFSLFSFAIIPYLPLILSNIRILFIHHKVNFFIFHALAYFILLTILSPSLFCMGRILPFLYTFIPKNAQDYGLKCGYLYFFNTLGTFSGAIIFGYLLFSLLDLREIYLITLGSFFVFGFYFLKWSNRLAIASLSILVICLPFSRNYHALGLFREREFKKGFHFENIFKKVNNKQPGLVYLRDGPNTTVSIFNYGDSKSIAVNGKSDGSTVGDYSTINFLGVLPYLINQQKNLNISIIGIGTGVTPGILSRLNRVNNLDVVEISDAVLNSLDFMEPENFSFHKNAKAKIYKNDAFQFFKTKREPYDIIISEPSNPWVMGVEDLFTPYFYRTVKKNLKTNGVFVQWIPLYSMSEEVVISIFNNLRKNFKEIKTYLFDDADLILVLSNQKDSLTIKDQVLEKPIEKVLKDQGINQLGDLDFFEVHNSKMIDYIIKTRPSFEHQIFYPQISYRSYFDFFMGNRALAHPENNIINLFFRRQFVDDRTPLLARAKDIVKEINCKEKRLYKQPLCLQIIPYFKKSFEKNKSPYFKDRLKSYSLLRDFGFVEKDLSFIKNALENLLTIKESNKDKEIRETSIKLIDELFKEAEFDWAMDVFKTLKKLKIIDQKEGQELLKKLSKMKSHYQETVTL